MKDEADAPVADVRAPIRIEREHVLVGKEIAALGRPIEQPEQVHQR